MPQPSKLDLAHTKAMRKKNKDKGGGSGKYGRNAKKCAQYRQRVGKPNGPGQSGQHNH